MRRDVILSDFNDPKHSTSANLGKWKIVLYDSGGEKPEAIFGQLVIDNVKYVIKDEETGDILFAAPSGNVAYAKLVD